MSAAASDITCNTFEVLHYTLCDGWVNCWAMLDEHGQWVPQTFPTREAAQAELDEFLSDIAADIAAGDRDPDDGYAIDEFVIVERDAGEPQPEGGAA